MSYYTFKLAANKTITVSVAGTVILIDDLGAANGLDVQPMFDGRDLPVMPARKKAFKFMEPFDGVRLTAPVDCTVGLFLSKNDVSLGFADGSLVNVSGQVAVTNGPGQRVPVDISGGTVNVTANNVGISNTNDNPVPVVQKTGVEFAVRPYLANQVQDNDPVAITAARTSVIAVGTARRGVRFKNTGANAVALGGVALTFAKAVILIQPGETWNESEAAAAAWYAICDAGLSSSLNIQSIC